MICFIGMAILVYNLSDNIRINLQKIDTLKTSIILYPLSPKDELQLKWNAKLTRIYWSLSFNDNPPSKSYIAKVLSSPTPKKLDPIVKEIIAQENAFSYIKQNWLVTQNKVKIKDIKKLYDISCKPVFGRAKGLTSLSEKNVSQILEYVQSGKENPVIQAGVAQSEILNTIPFEQGNAKISRLINYIFLYKGAYDAREMLVIDEYFRKDPVAFKQALDSVTRNNNLTYWLEYFTSILVLSLSKTLEGLRNSNYYSDVRSSFWRLNERQLEILRVLEIPEAKISNHQVQKMFEISQITASRDLSKLLKLGLLFSYGKGRSVFYRRV